MAAISEDYVSLEVAKLLNIKGFSGEFRKQYWGYVTGKEFLTESSFNPEYDYPAPTLHVAMKWLREVHKISIEITSTGYLVDNDVEWECDIKAGHRLYFKHITNEKSFESCAEAAIKYCLENLI